MFMTKHEQSILPKPGILPDQETLYKVSSFCQKCRYHLDLIVDFHDYGVRNAPCPNKDFPLHHFIYQEEDPNEQDVYLDHNIPKTFRFQCSAKQCPANLRISIRPPRLKEQYIRLMTDRTFLRRRLESAKRIDPDRTDHMMARPIDGLDFLSSYMKDSLNPQKGKTRIPLLNRKFLVTYGRDCDEMLTEFGFTREVENNGNGDEICWYIPRPPAESDPLAGDNLRVMVEDVIAELSVLISDRADSEKQGVRNTVILPQPSQAEIERALGCLDYNKRIMARAEAKRATEEEDHPYYAGLGALGDFSDELILFAYDRQVETDPRNAAYYFECLQDLAIGRKSPVLEEKVQILASQGQTNRKEVAKAYGYFGIDPLHSTHLTDEIIIGTFRARLQDISPTLEEETRNMLRIVGQARQSSAILQEASNAIETYAQALSWLDISANTPDEFVQTMFTVKTEENPASRDIAVKAVELIAQHRNSERLRSFLINGKMGPEMDIGEAYQILGIQDRVAAIDPTVLVTTLEVQKQIDSDNIPRLEQAYRLICKERFGDAEGGYGAAAPEEPIETHPLDTWPVGCQNIGNTCYLNSVLQFLFTIRPLREMVLNFDNYKQECTPEAIKDKIVGRRKPSIEVVKKAQEFVFELKKLFHMMIQAPSPSVRPEVKLAFLALVKDAQGDPPTKTSPSKGLGVICGMPVMGPMPNPSKADELESKLGDSSVIDGAAMTGLSAVNGSDTQITDGPGQDDSSDKKDNANPFKDNLYEEAIDLDAIDIVSEPTKPDPPSRPPPVPPRPKAALQDSVSTTVEYAARQQDAAEIMMNIFDLFGCAIKPMGTMEDGEQIDLIKELFYTNITYARTTNGTTTLKSDIQDHILTSPGDKDRHIYSALDDEFDIDDLDDPTTRDGAKSTKYEFIARLPPVLIINVRRAVYNAKEEKSFKNERHVALDDTLYLDRYLESTKSMTAAQLLETRKEQWEYKRQLRALQRRKAELEQTALEMSLSDVVECAADYITDLKTADEELLVDLDPLPIEPGLAEQMRIKAHNLRKDSSLLDEPIRQLEERIESHFDGLKDHPYRLHAIFIHRGTATGGHYWIYIHDFKENIWRKYNDERVTEVTDIKEIFTQEEKWPATSTGIVYVREEGKDALTEAVKRDPAKPPSGDVEMKDISDEFANAEVIDGVPA